MPHPKVRLNPAFALALGYDICSCSLLRLLQVNNRPDGDIGQMSVLDALKGVLKLALMHDGLARGLREASKALDRRQAHMCVLNEACEEEAYKKLVVALCSEHKIPLIKVPDGKQLGEWAGLCE
jgi:small subunit ribosomal protein S12e